jgi:hypothetical protein
MAISKAVSVQSFSLITRAGTEAAQQAIREADRNICDLRSPGPSVFVDDAPSESTSHNAGNAGLLTIVGIPANRACHDERCQST